MDPLQQVKIVFFYLFGVSCRTPLSCVYHSEEKKTDEDKHMIITLCKIANQFTLHYLQS
jgi:hypothetical protein